jgi:hypothetical protein
MGRTDEEAWAKYEQLNTYASSVGSASSSADGRASISRGFRSTRDHGGGLGRGGPDREYSGRVHDHKQGHPAVDAAGGGGGGVDRRAGTVAMAHWTAVTVSDEMERWIAEADLDGSTSATCRRRGR